MNNWFKVIAEDTTAGLYQRLIAHILSSLTETMDKTELARINARAFVNSLVDDDALWTPVDDYLMKKLNEELNKGKEVSKMEKFLKEYVEVMVSANDIELNPEKIQEIVNNLHDEDELWDTFDSFVINEINRAKEVK